LPEAGSCAIQITDSGFIYKAARLPTEQAAPMRATEVLGLSRLRLQLIYGLAASREHYLPLAVAAEE
jgi:hypothetical protein